MNSCIAIKKNDGALYVLVWNDLQDLLLVKKTRCRKNSILPFLQRKKEIKPLEFMSIELHIKF